MTHHTHAAYLIPVSFNVVVLVLFAFVRKCSVSVKVPGAVGVNSVVRVQYAPTFATVPNWQPLSEPGEIAKRPTPFPLSV